VTSPEKIFALRSPGQGTIQPRRGTPARSGQPAARRVILHPAGTRAASAGGVQVGLCVNTDQGDADQVERPASCLETNFKRRLIGELNARESKWGSPPEPAARPVSLLRQPERRAIIRHLQGSGTNRLARCQVKRSRGQQIGSRCHCRHVPTGYRYIWSGGPGASCPAPQRSGPLLQSAKGLKLCG
jgi:hypothetical protein